MLDGKYIPRSGWTSEVVAGRAVLEVESADAALAGRLIAEFEKFVEFKNGIEELGGDWRRTNLIDFQGEGYAQGDIRLSNAGMALIKVFDDEPGTDKQVEWLLKGVLSALAFVHDEFAKSGEGRGHGNVRPELIFMSLETREAPYVLGPTLGRVPGPYQPELYPAKSFERQIPTTNGDLYALGMIALRLRMGNTAYAEYYSEIYEIDGDQDIGASWQGWHDNIFAHPNLSRMMQTGDRLNKFIQTLLQRNVDAQFDSARHAFEELTEFTGAIEYKALEDDKINVEETAEEEFDPFKVEKKKSDKPWLNYVLVAACALVALIVGLVIFKVPIPGNPFGTGSGVVLAASDDDIAIDMAAANSESCNIITGHGSCSVDDVTAKRTRKLEQLRQEMFVANATLGDETKRDAPFNFEPEPGLNVQISRDGKLTVDSRDMSVSKDSVPKVFDILYTVKVKNKTDEGTVKLSLNVPNTTPRAILDDIKIPVDKVADFATASLLKNDVDPDLANKISGWTFEEEIQIETINGSPLSGESFEMPMSGSDVKIRINRDGSFQFLDLPNILEEETLAEFSYSISDQLGAKSESVNAKIVVTKPDWENSPPVAQPDALGIDLAVQQLPQSFNVLANNGNGPDTDNDISDEMKAIGIIDALVVSEVDGQIIDGPTEIGFTNETKVRVSPNGDVEILSGPKNLTFNNPIVEEFQYVISDNYGGQSRGLGQLGFMVSVDPDYAQLNENWKIKVRGKVPNGTYKSVNGENLPTVEDCRSFARNLTPDVAKRLDHPDYGFLGEIWVQELDKLSVCILQKSDDGSFQAKLKSDATVRTSFAAYIVTAMED